MKFIIKLISLSVLISLFTACESEEVIISDFNGKDPFPLIEEGTTEASQLAFGLLEEHELHMYYDLEGEEALQTEYGAISLASRFGDGIIAAEEERAVVFLKLIDEMFDLFSDYRELQLARRWMLVGNGFSSSTAEQLNTYGYSRDILYYNTQGTQILSSVNNTFEFDLSLTKEMLLFAYFYAYIDYTYDIPEEFSSISGDIYRQYTFHSVPFYTSATEYDEEGATDAGFVHPWGPQSISLKPHEDWESYVVWIISRPKAERDVWLDTKPLIKAKYDIVVESMMTDLNMDLEALSIQWQSVGI
ncbi:hypothetical protein ACFFU1_14790 [Algibacter miyuki]|uniref:Uncharacterized protein n=1 Tax=Algibacter miyuki TaxID=1306933 RepID=A0ABV5H301_9FLAO|nr:hypothetical protein [Algibacter miyuki]MDN3663854.1 hypothetical protein [Algibacter miyuki]